MILELEHIYKNYEQGKMEVPVLKDISFSVEKGEYVAIMGPSGSGKTTLMNIIGCLDRPTSGSYRLAGRDLNQLSEREMSDVRLHEIGFVFQSFHLMPRESAVSNVALPLLYAGVKKKERRRLAEEALGRVGLSDRTEFKPTQMSGGQNQRVAIARAMANDPSIILADEPTGALDSKSTQELLSLFKKINSTGETILMVTHSIKAASCANRVLFIRDGQIYHQLYKGDNSDDSFYQIISESLTMMLTRGEEK